MVFTKTAQAKVLPQAAKASKAVGAASNATNISVSARLRSDRKALIVNFADLQAATNVSYLLTYKTDVQDEGARGGISVDGSSYVSQELLFGTCSKGVCRYHTGISDTRLEVSYTTKAGRKYLKKFKIKV